MKRSLSRHSTRFENRVLWLALGAGLPGGSVALYFLWTAGVDGKVVWTLTIVIVTAWLWIAFILRDTVVRPIQTLSNMLAALAEGDYTIRARVEGADDVLGLAVSELNALSEALRGQRYSRVEAEALLRRVMEEIDVAVFAFDDQHVLQLANRAAEKFLLREGHEILGKTAEELSLGDCLVGATPRIVDMSSNTNPGQWELRRSIFRLEGLPHSLVVLSDLSRVLRGAERQTWKRLVRVLSHEINNSLAPIKSIAGSLQNRLKTGMANGDATGALEKGLNVIQSRAESLNVFMASYSKLAKLPEPDLQKLDVQELIDEVAGLEISRTVRVKRGLPVFIQADGAQLGQLLINCVKNAVEAAAETNGAVEIGWDVDDQNIEIWIRDEGPGITDTKNLFVPFYSTKPRGSGIGLVLCRQIAEGHGGTLDLENRRDGVGTVARLRLPLEPVDAA